MQEWTRGDPAKGPGQAPLARGGKLDADTLVGAYRSRRAFLGTPPASR
jgi:hypothetical protein